MKISKNWKVFRSGMYYCHRSTLQSMWWLPWAGYLYTISTNIVMPCVELIESQKQFGLCKDIWVKLGSFYGDVIIPIVNAHQLKLDDDLAGLKLNTFGNFVSLSLFLCDSTSKEIIVSDKKTLSFSDPKLVVKYGFVWFKIFSNLTTRDWENWKWNRGKLFLLFSFVKLIHINIITQNNYRFLDHYSEVLFWVHSWTMCFRTRILFKLCHWCQ